MKILGYNIAKSRADDPAHASGRSDDAPYAEIEKSVTEWAWTRSILTSTYLTAPPQVDPFLLAALFDANGYHSNAIYLKRDIVIGQGYNCSDRLREIIEFPNSKQSFQDLLEITQLDLELYGDMYVEVATTDFKNWALYHSPSLATRVKPPLSGFGEEGYVQFAYGFFNGAKNLTGVEFDEFQPDRRSGIRHLKLASPVGDRWYGHPEYLSSKLLLQLNFNIAGLANRWFSNAMIMDKLFLLEGAKLSKPQKEELTNFMRDNLRGVKNAAKSLLLELQRGAKMDVKDMQAQVKEASFSGLRADNRDEIASAHRVPPRWLGIIPAGALGAVGEIDGQIRMFEIGFANPRRRRVERFWKRLFRDMNLPDWQTFELKSVPLNSNPLDARGLAQLTSAGVLPPQFAGQQAVDQWFTEKGFTPEGADQFVKMLAAIEKGVARL